MSKHAKYWLAGAFAVGFVAIGIPFWQIPYNRVSLPGTLYGPGLWVVPVAALTARAVGKAKLLWVILFASAAIPAAILVRVAIETTRDPTSHNLWPIEIVIGLVVGLACATGGAIVGSIPLWFSMRSETK